MSTNKKGALHISGDELVLLAAIVVVFTLSTTPNKNFFSVTSIINILIAASLVGLVTIGHTYLVIAGQNDLSPGSLATFSGVMAALLTGRGFSFSLAVLLTITCGITIGCLNAFMVNRIHPETFITTLVTRSIVRGFVYIICGGKPIFISSRSSPILGKVQIANIPLSVRIMVLCIMISGIILARARFGRGVHATGGSMDVARLAGLNPRRTTATCYVMISILCSIGGIIFTVRMSSGQPAANADLEFDTITTVIPGGVPFVGGVGDMGGMTPDTILIQTFNTGLTMVNVPTFWQYVVKDGLLLFALTTDYVRKQRREKELLTASMKNLQGPFEIEEI